MPKSSRKSQPSKKLRSETPPPSELEDVIVPELAKGEISVGTPTSSTYVVSEADTASGTSSAGEERTLSYRLSLSFQLQQGRLPRRLLLPRRQSRPPG